MRTAVIVVVSLMVGAVGMAVFIIVKVDRALRGKGD